MNKLNLASTILFLLVFFSSCTKDGDNTIPQPATCKITGINDMGVQYKVHYAGNKIDYIASNTDSVIFEYNSNGRIITRTEFTSFFSAFYPSEKFTFEYNGNDIVKENYYIFIDPTEKFRLMRQSVFTYVAGQVSNMKLYTGQLEPMETYHFTLTNGNVTNVNVVSADGTNSVNYTYHFDLTRENYLTKYFPDIFMLWPHHIQEMYDEFFSKNIITGGVGTDGLPQDVKHTVNADGYIVEVDWLGRNTKISYECPYP